MNRSIDGICYIDADLSRESEEERLKLGRNSPCHCGSGKKFKRCHGAHFVQPPHRYISRAEPQNFYDQHLAREHIRKKQQGLGRPILSAKLGDRQVVVVGNMLFHTKGKTFIDFLSQYIKTVLTPEWGNAEIAKPLQERHQIMQWYDHYCHYQRQHIRQEGQVFQAPLTGLIACYIGLAYALYLIHHNVELQDRLVRRLKDPGNFQGAYYELMVASVLIRAGFKLTLEDETDGASKHCEFAAVSTISGRKFWVEAKMRAVAGILGRNASDGSPDDNPLSQLNRHLTRALRKPAADDRLIFVDLNCEINPADRDIPSWGGPALHALLRYEARHPNDKAVVIVTNFPYHRMLDQVAATGGLLFGLNIPELRPGNASLLEHYRTKQKHIDAFNIMQSLSQYTSFPPTFDGSLPSESLAGEAPRLQIGETYFFQDDNGEGMLGTVTSAAVLEDKREVWIAVTSPDGKSHLRRGSMSEEAINDYKAHPEAYFGRVEHPKLKSDDPLELFEWMMETTKNISRGQMLAWFNRLPDGHERMTDEQLRELYCERHVLSMMHRKNAPPKEPTSG